MNEERIQQVLSIEKEANQIHEVAVHDSEQLLMQANQEVDTIMEKAQKEAKQEAQQLVAEAQAKEEGERILGDVEEKVRRATDLAGEKF